MIRQILGRLQTVPLTLLLVALVAFVVLRITGDPVELYLDINATAEQRQILTARLHLDDPLIVQFALFIGNWMRTACCPFPPHPALACNSTRTLCRNIPA